MTPIVEASFRLIQGDGWSYIFPLVQSLTGDEFVIAGYSASFSLRQNYGDSSALIAMTTSTPSANGSTLAVVIPPGASFLSGLQLIVVGTDTALLVALVGARQAKFYGTLKMTPPGGQPITVSAMTWYVGAST